MAPDAGLIVRPKSPIILYLLAFIIFGDTPGDTMRNEIKFYIIKISLFYCQVF